MRIVTKINAALAALIGVSVALNYAALSLTVKPSFAELEAATARDNHARVLEAIKVVGGKAQLLARDYGYWDDTVEFMSTTNQEYLTENITAASFASLGINYFAIVDRSGGMVLNSGFDFSGEEPAEIRLFSQGGIPVDHPVFAAATARQPMSGLMRTSQGLVAVGYAAVIPTDLKGEARGVLVTGTILDIDEVKATTKVGFDLALVERSAGPGEERAAPALRVGDTDVTVTSLLQGLDGAAVAKIVSKTPRAISRLGDRTIWAALALIVAVGALVLGTLGMLLQRIALSRVERMRSHLAEVGSSGALRAMDDDRRGDELSDVTAAFNTMAAQLAELREQLRQQDYKSGAAAHAAGVLHNVRNGISPIGVIAWNLARAEEAGWRGNVGKALAELNEPAVTPERRSKLQEFVIVSAERFLSESTDRKREFDTIGDLVRQVDAVLKGHDETSHFKPEPERVELGTALKQAGSLVMNRPTAKIAIAVAADMPAVLADKLALDQVLGNVLINAAEAIEATGHATGAISVTSIPTSVDGRPAVDVAVTDDGEGIAAGDLERIFEAGFSRRLGRSGGLGLHWSANAVIAMGGRLHAESAGPGHGATLHIVLLRADQQHQIAAAA